MESRTLLWIDGLFLTIKDRGLTVKQASKQIGIGARTLHRWHVKRTTPREASRRAGDVWRAQNETGRTHEGTQGNPKSTNG